MRKKVNIDIVSDEMNIWARFQKHEKGFPEQLPELNEYKKLNDKLMVFPDPRIKQMGIRQVIKLT